MSVTCTKLYVKRMKNFKWGDTYLLERQKKETTDLIYVRPNKFLNSNKIIIIIIFQLDASTVWRRKYIKKE